MITALLYELVLWILLMAALPKMAYNFFVHKKYRSSLLARSGLKDQGAIKRSPYLIWIHAVSVGETKAVAQLAKVLKTECYNSQLVISSVTETGHAEAKRSLPFADQHIYLPFDFTWITKFLVRKLSPDVLILSESDLWYNVLRYAKKEGAIVALVNGKLSTRSTARFSAIPIFSRQLFQQFDLIAVQNSSYQQRFIKAGADPSKVLVTGNLKFDEEYPRLSPAEIALWREHLGIRSGQLVLTVGSTHDPEESIIVPILKKLWAEGVDLKVLLVPRHPERFKTVAQLLHQEGISFIPYTQLSNKSGEEQLVLVDAMGILRNCYQLCDLALVGGSFTDKVGGHNILEPCWYGKPVFFGPHMHSQLEFVELIKQYEAGEQIERAQLFSTLEFYIRHIDERTAMGKKGERLVANLKSATQETLNALNKLLQTKA